MLSTRGDDILMQKITRNPTHGASYAPVPAGRERTAIAAMDNELLLFGGVKLSFTSEVAEVELSGETWTYDVRLMRWFAHTGSTAPDARQGHSLVSRQSEAFLFGGSTVYLPLTPASQVGGSGVAA
eukprot:3823920-Rhodomonas_salina.1